MKKRYLDRSQTDGCCLVFAEGAEKYDIHFIFDDHIPAVDFYAVPQFDIFAADRNGGFIGTVSQMTDLEGQAPIQKWKRS